MSWLFTRGTLKAHYVRDGKSVCGSGSKFDPPVPDHIFDLGKYKCKKCLHKLELQKAELIIPQGDTFYSEYCREFSGPGADR